jgi:predicted phage replisome organizer
MRERKYVKFRVDMYDDTKFKIIDRKPERDVIHYIWNRIVMLAGKVNMEGNLFLSKSIPYTIETLSIEFNRDSAQVKLALDTFIELEMVEFIEDKIYRVKNFVKHQNIKVKEQEICKDLNKDLNNIDGLLDENVEATININNKLKEHKKIDNSLESTTKNSIGDLEIQNNKCIEIDQKMSNKTSEDISKKDPPIILISRKNTKRRKGKNKEILNYDNMSGDIICQDIIDEDMCGIVDENTPLRPGISIAEYSFV